jgi:spoIIIJ-associated protein
MDQEKIKQQIQKLLELMGVTGTVAIEDRAGQLTFNIKTQEPKLLIGQYGANLNALQHIVRLLVRPQESATLESAVNFIVDVEDYRKERQQFLEALARQAAERVRSTKQTLVLKPMNRSDRWVIHTQLAQYEDLISESEGEEPERKIVIKPKN